MIFTFNTKSSFSGLPFIVCLCLSVMSFFLTTSGELQAQRVIAKNKINGRTLTINVQKKVKYKLVAKQKLYKGNIEAVDKDWIQISGKKLPLHDIVEIRSWAVKNKGGSKTAGYLLTGGGVLVTALAVGTLGESGEGGYGGITKMLGLSFGALGAGSTYHGLRMLKRKVFYVAHWEFATYP